MQKFTTVQGIVAPFDRSNIDTDAIIPKQFLKSIKRSGFGPNLFDDWRYLDEGVPDADNSHRKLNPDFVLNQPRYQDAKVLLTRDNFGCGSSREHAPWALKDFGFDVIIATSYADIFYNNCFKNSLLPIIQPSTVIDQLFTALAQQEGYALTIELAEQAIIAPDGQRWGFEVDAFRKNCLLEGLDDIGLTLQHADAIRAYEAKRKTVTPWIFE